VVNFVKKIDQEFDKNDFFMRQIYKNLNWTKKDFKYRFKFINFTKSRSIKILKNRNSKPLNLLKFSKTLDKFLNPQISNLHTCLHRQTHQRNMYSSPNGNVQEQKVGILMLKLTWVTSSILGIITGCSCQVFVRSFSREKQCFISGYRFRCHFFWSNTTHKML
jgi:hypothetical protein